MFLYFDISIFIIEIYSIGAGVFAGLLYRTEKEGSMESLVVVFLWPIVALAHIIKTLWLTIKTKKSRKGEEG